MLIKSYGRLNRKWIKIFFFLFFFFMNKGKDLNLLSTSNKEICIKYKPSMFISILGWGQN